MMKLKSLSLLIVLFLAGLVTQSGHAQEQPIVRAVMFWQAGCPHCEETIQQTLPPLREKYGSQLELLMVEVVSIDDIKMLYDIGASYNLTREQTGVPMVIVGDQVLVGSDQVAQQFPALIADALAQGGVDWPTNPLLQEFLPAGSTPLSAPVNAPQEEARNNGFGLAIGIMVFIVIAMIYSLVAFVLGKTYFLPAWGDWLILVIILVGIGVASYLTYIETQPVTPFCGPIGNCETVQHNPQSRLFGILPMGIFGLIGYFGLLSAWLTHRFLPSLKQFASQAFVGMAFFAVLFSLYLTYLEPFVIHAVCIWCLTSAVLVTLLLLLGLPHAIQEFSMSEDD